MASIRRGSSGSGPARTLLVPFTYSSLDIDALEGILNAGAGTVGGTDGGTGTVTLRRWKRVTLAEAQAAGHVDLIVSDGLAPAESERSLYSITARLKSRIVARRMTNKVDLHLMLTHYHPNLVCDSFVVDDSSTIRDGDVWIWRAEAAWAGDGVAVISTQVRVLGHQQPDKCFRLKAYEQSVE